MSDDESWIKVGYAKHLIRPWCREERCACGAAATHKIEEITGPMDFHPFTTYVCCECFFGPCEGRYPYGPLYD